MAHDALDSLQYLEDPIAGHPTLLWIHLVISRNTVSPPPRTVITVQYSFDGLLSLCRIQKQISRSVRFTVGIPHL